VKIILVVSGISEIGGVETYCVNWCKRLCGTYEIELVYEYCHEVKLKTLSQYATMTKFNPNKTYKADKVIYVTGWGKCHTVKNYEATSGEYWQEVHADYEYYASSQAENRFTYQPLSNITGYICVSQTAKDKLIKKYKSVIKTDNIIVLYNMVDNEAQGRKLLRLITATRIRPEKGCNRMLQMADKLREADIPFVWEVYGDIDFKPYGVEWAKKVVDYSEFIVHGRKHNLHNEIKSADYLVQLSNSEGYCMSICEALQQGTPCICTDFPSVYEQLTDGINGYIFKMDLSDFDVKKILNIPKGFKYEEKTNERDWVKLMGDPKSKTKKPALIEIVCITPYKDMQLDERLIAAGEVLSVTIDRAQYLCEDRKYCKLK
jgi:glycosyltransferase involved in cell wall biosynthesis